MGGGGGAWWLQPMGGLEQGLDNGVFEQGELAAGEAQTVFEVLGKLLALETGEVETHDDALVECLVDGHGEAASELGESDEEEAQTVFGLDVVQRQQSEVFEDVVSQVMGASSNTSRGRCLSSTHSRVISARITW